MPESLSQLRPLGLKEIIAESIDLCRSNWRFLLWIGGLVLIPATILGNVLQQTPKLGVVWWAGLAIPGILGFLSLTAFMAGATDLYSGKPATTATCYRYAVRRISQLIDTLLAFAGLFVAGFIALTIAELASGIVLAILLIPFGLIHHPQTLNRAPLVHGLSWLVGAAMECGLVVVYARVSLVWAAFAGERLFGTQAIKRSWHLVRGPKFWQSIAVMAVCDVAAMVVWVPAIGLFRVLGRSTVAALVNGTVQGVCATLCLPLREVPRIILYYDLRTRLLKPGETLPGRPE